MNFASKPARMTAGISSQHSSVGGQAAALVPPAYGIDFVDSGARAAAPVQRVGGPASKELLPPEMEEETLQGKFDAAPGTATRAWGHELHSTREAWHPVQPPRGGMKPALHAKAGPPVQLMMDDDDEDYEPGSDQEYDDKKDAEDDAAPAYEANIPYGKAQKTTDGATTYATSAAGYVDFDNPTSGTAIKKAGSVNITADISGIAKKKKYKGNTAKATRANHNTVANILYEKKAPPANKSASPAGYTWHHVVAPVGRMDLLDRDEHAHIKHKGGHSVWGR